MTNYLVRRFVPDYENIEDSDVRTSYGVLSSGVGILCNVLLFGVKLIIGILMHSIAITADAFNNLSDAASSIIGYVGVKIAGKPADEEHPFGHGRVEYVAALIVAFLVIEVGLTFLKSSIGKIKNPEDIAFELVPFVILVLSVGVKVWMGTFNRALGKRIDSKVMLATAADSFGDVITTTTTIVSILVSTFTGVNIDAVAGILVSFIVMWAGIGIAKDTLEPLIGEAVDSELAQKVKNEVEGYDGIVGTHDLIVHNYGPNHSMASIHAEVPNDVDISVSHEIIDRIEREVSKKLGIFLVIHMDPIEVKDENVLEVKEELVKILAHIDERVTFHDFRMVGGEKQINLIFDIVVPYSYDKERQKELKKEIRKAYKEIDPRFVCVITVDQEYCKDPEK